MSKVYFLARWWPHFETTFPFDRFDDIPDDRMRAELEQLAAEYASTHASEIIAAREKRVKLSNARLAGQMSSPRSKPVPIAVAKTLTERPALWAEVSEFASWTNRGGGLVVDVDDARFGRAPTPWKAFYVMWDHPVAPDVLDVVRDQIRPPHGVYTFRVEKKDDIPTKRWVIWEKAVEEIRQSIKRKAPYISPEKEKMRRWAEHAWATQSVVSEWLKDLFREAQSAEHIIASNLPPEVATDDGNGEVPNQDDSAANQIDESGSQTGEALDTDDDTPASDEAARSAQVQSGEPTERHTANPSVSDSAGRLPGKSGRLQNPAPDGWIYVVDAATKYCVPRATAHRYKGELRPEKRRTDDTSNRVMVEITAFEEVLRARGWLK